jgi:hypothetical protein
MKVGDEDMPHLAEAHPAASQLHLYALATIYHEELVAKLYNLCRRVVAQRRQRTAASQDMHLECIHQWFLNSFYTRFHEREYPIHTVSASGLISKGSEWLGYIL